MNSMATRLREAMLQRLQDLRYEPTEKRIRATAGGVAVVDSRQAMLVWEPRRVVPSYAVPDEDVRGELVPAAPGPDGASEPPVLPPVIPFAVHSTEGVPLTIRMASQTLEGAAFRPADPDLASYVVLDWHAFDDWLEEDEPVAGHARDPFHRVDIRRSSRHLRIELDGRLLAETTRPTVLFETSLPTRYYLPREDLRVDVAPSSRRTYCPYKGEASYLSVETADGPRDLIWCYEDPLPDAMGIKGLVAFFDERVNVVVDGERRELNTPFGTIIADEVGV
jgi:uncharacterized protein (DUF427 family)